MTNLFISLGGNCSITYQLNKYNLRFLSFPYDWSKLNTNQLINSLESDFSNFSESLEIKKVSYNHLLESKLPSFSDFSLILKNIYGINFAHEINTISKLEKFKNKLAERITRFRNLNNLDFENITFLRIELQPLKLDYILKINKLLVLLSNYISNFTLKLIIHEKSSSYIKKLENNKNIEIYYFQTFTDDWKMDIIDWKTILEI